MENLFERENYHDEMIGCGTLGGCAFGCSGSCGGNCTSDCSGSCKGDCSGNCKNQLVRQGYYK